MAFGIINFAVANNLADGGFSGITIILFHLFGFSTGISSFLMNLPLLFICYRLFDKHTFFMTIFGIISLSTSLTFFETIGPLIPNLENDMILVVIGYGVTLGVGLGMILRVNGTTGGAAVLAKIAKDLWNIPLAKTLFIFDTCVVIASFFLFLSFENGVYTLIGLFICSRVIAKIQEGFHSGYKILIISDHYKEITQEIHNQMGRGTTLIQGIGGYTHAEKNIILTIITPNQLVGVKKIIYGIDSQAFVSVSHTYETIGEGFTFDNETRPSLVAKKIMD